ncbi:unnamed protein product [Symbiodinium natans]|uniref:C3H1-type domain-containing protein n=1 Tax=Symbiodinium natans TaxID=878477 RepID=A0A812Q7Y4_9DINO|nr:unnamed protein product [Symbiodinium natans]
MALELEYRRTFIDVKEDFEDMVESSSRARAQSAPARPMPSIDSSSEAASEEEASEEEAMRSYVGTLSQKMADLAHQLQQGKTPTTACGSSPTNTTASDVSEGQEEAWSTDQVAAEFFPLLPSQGSLGHPEVCRRPCIYFIAGHCENGQACAYCHMEHTEKTPKLDKRQRNIIQHLSQPQMSKLVMHFCRSKAEQAGFLEEAKEILNLLAQESEGARPWAQVLMDRDLRNLHKTLERMNFSNLICLAASHSASQGNASAEMLVESLERLRLLSLQGR